MIATRLWRLLLLVSLGGCSGPGGDPPVEAPRGPDQPRAAVGDTPGIDDDAAEATPTVIVCDVEGEELNLMQTALPPNVRLVIMEIHRTWLGDAGIAQLFAEMFGEKTLPGSGRSGL